MEISSITGPDFVPTGFSAEEPRTEKAADEAREETAQRERPPEDKGTRIDTYA